MAAFRTRAGNIQAMAGPPCSVERKEVIFKKITALARVAQMVGVSPHNLKVVGSIPNPQSGCVPEATN